MTGSWLGSWGRGKKDHPAPPPMAPEALIRPVEARREPAHTPTTSLHDLILRALQSEAERSGLPAYRFVERVVDIRQRDYYSWLKGKQRIRMSNFEKMVAALGWTITITDKAGNPL